MGGKYLETVTWAVALAATVLVILVRFADRIWGEELNKALRSRIDPWLIKIWEDQILPYFLLPLQRLSKYFMRPNSSIFWCLLLLIQGSIFFTLMAGGSSYIAIPVPAPRSIVSVPAEPESPADESKLCASECLGFNQWLAGSEFVLIDIGGKAAPYDNVNWSIGSVSKVKDQGNGTEFIKLLNVNVIGLEDTRVISATSLIPGVGESEKSGTKRGNRLDNCEVLYGAVYNSSMAKANKAVFVYHPSEADCVFPRP